MRRRARVQARVRRRARVQAHVRRRPEPRTRSKGRMVVLVPFVVPIVGDKTLLVWELSCGPTAEALQVSRAGAEGGVEEATSRLSNWAPRGTASAPHLPVVSAERNLSSRADLSSQLAPTDF